MNKFLQSILLGWGRTLITASIVPALLAAGVIKTTDVNSTEGSMIFLLGIAVPAALSAWDKWVAKKKIAQAAADPMGPLATAAKQPVVIGRVTMNPIPNP